jgi:hypothetical protein
MSRFLTELLPCGKWKGCRKRLVSLEPDHALRFLLRIGDGIRQIRKAHQSREADRHENFRTLLQIGDSWSQVSQLMRGNTNGKLVLEMPTILAKGRREESERRIAV